MAEISSVTECTANWSLQRQLALNSELETGSTNDNAKTNAFNDEAELALYLTAHQTAGKGRGENTWMDTGAGESLLSTWSFKARSAPQAITGPRVGLAVFIAVSKVWPALNWSLKAPNDLFLDGVKCGGILVESASQGDRHRLIIGFGFNVLNHPRKFPATHLAQALGSRPSESDWFRFLDELHAQFVMVLSDAVKPELTAAARKELIRALNANPALAMAITDVTPQGDLVHANGKIRWTDL